MGIDACSPNEVEHAISAGFDPQEISFTNTSLSRQDLDRLARIDGLRINCDSLHTIEQWGARRPGSTIGIRINPAVGVGRAANDKLQYAGPETTKFGIYRDRFQEALMLAQGGLVEDVRAGFRARSFDVLPSALTSPWLTSSEFACDRGCVSSATCAWHGCAAPQQLR